MGWRLAEAVLDDCPDIPYREFRVLMAFAHDARDATCTGMPGLELLARRGGCSERTAKRVMASLTARGLVKIEERSAPGRRTVYRLLPMPGSAAERGTTVLASVPPVDNPPADESRDQPTGDNGIGLRSESNGGQSGDQRGTDPAPTGDTTVGPPAVKPPSDHSSEIVVPESHLYVEGVGSGEGKPDNGEVPGFDLRTRQGTEAARQAMSAALAEWERQQQQGGAERGDKEPAGPVSGANGHGHMRPSTIRRREETTKRIIKAIGARDGINGMQLQAKVGGNRQVNLQLLNKLTDDGIVIVERDPGDKRKISYRLAAR